MDGKTAFGQPNSLRWLTWPLWALALAGLLYLAGLTAWLGITGLFFPYQLDYGEGVHLYYVKEWLASRPIYRPIGSYPYLTSNYGPLSCLLAMALTPILGVGYAAGRLWTLLAILAVTALIGAWVRRETGRWLPAAVAALAFVGSPYIYHWAPLFRVDLPGLALTLGGLYAVYRAMPAAPTNSPGAKQEERPWLLRLAVVLFVAALYTKQSFVFAPAAALAYLFLIGARRQALTMLLAMGLLGGGLFLAINAATGGSFWSSLVVANVNPFLWAEFWPQQGDFFGTFALLTLLTAWYMVDKFLLERIVLLRDKVALLDLYLPTALLSVLLAGKVGAWENYFFEALAALALCGGLGLARLAPHHCPFVGRGARGIGVNLRPKLALTPPPGPLPSPKLGRGEGVGGAERVFLLLAPLLVLGQVALMWHTPRLASRYIALTRQSYEEMAPILAQTPDPIFAEDMGLLVTYGKTLDYHSFEYSQLARVGRWDQSWELDQLRSRRRSLVILERGTRLDVDRYRRFTRAFLSELDRNYRHNRTVGKYELYEPDPLQYERRAEFGDQLALVGWSLHASPDLQPGDTVSLTVVWQAQQALTTDYTAFAHLIDESGQGWAGDDHAPYGGLYPTTAWGAGEMVRDAFTLTIPTEAPPGLYDVQVGWYLSAAPSFHSGLRLGAGPPTTLERLPVGDGTSFRVAVLPVAWQGVGPLPMNGVDARFGQAIRLTGYAWSVGPQAIELTLRWIADAYVAADYTVFVHLVGQDGEGPALSQGDAPPLAGRWPTSLWRPGVALDDRHTIPLPADLAPGSYCLLVGLYEPGTGARLPLAEGGDALRLGEVYLP